MQPDVPFHWLKEGILKRHRAHIGKLTPESFNIYNSNEICEMRAGYLAEYPT